MKIAVNLCLLLGFCLGATAQAEQRALLVGVGQYQTPGIDLPGIDLDLERVRDTLVRMGFTDSQIRILRDSDATSTAVIRNFETWLKEGVQPQDRVVFYFSGHGSNVPDTGKDEQDGVDEVLVTHDMKRARVNGRATLTGVVVDDKLAELIGAIPSRNVWVIVDSCHSGTVTRSFSLKNRSLARDAVYVKSFNYAGMPAPATKQSTRSILSRGVDSGTRAATSDNFVSLTAAADGEEAIGTSRGGVFTIGLTEAFKRLSTQGKTPTVQALKDEATAYIRSKVDKAQMHTPQLNGNPQLASGSLLPSAKPAPELGPNRQRLLDLIEKQGNALKIASSSAKYSLDQPVSLSIEVPFAGYLNVVAVDADDTATVIYPNRHQPQNTVQPGTLRVPSESMDFELLAAEPLGPTMVAAFLTSAPVNFFNETLDERDSQGRINVDFPALSYTATRAIRVAPREARSYAGRLEIEVVR